MKEVNPNALAGETKVYHSVAGSHMTFMLWIPKEYWKARLSQVAPSRFLTKADKQALLDSVEGVSILFVYQANMTEPGVYEFHSKKSIEDTMRVFYTDASGAKQRLPPMRAISRDLEYVIDAFRFTLVGTAGDIGENTHFFVFNDKKFSREESITRLIDPYQKGLITVQLEEKNGSLFVGTIDTPLNTLFTPRKCPNGKDAHISWKFCPWTGQRLED